jgi:thiamine pyrophosphokinase
MKTGVLFIGGEYPREEVIDAVLAGAEYVVAADSGYDYLRQREIACDLVVGDMDSTRYGREIAELGEERVQRFDAQKDETDTEIGLRSLVERGVEYPIIIGGGGGRLDHLLAVASLFDRSLRPREWISRQARVISVEERLLVEGRKGRTVSLFPAGDQPCRIHSQGLKWPLDQLTWLKQRGDGGVSNEVTEDPLLLEPYSGRAMLVIPQTDAV